MIYKIAGRDDYKLAPRKKFQLRMRTGEFFTIINVVVQFFSLFFFEKVVIAIYIYIYILNWWRGIEMISEYT